MASPRGNECCFERNAHMATAREYEHNANFLGYEGAKKDNSDDWLNFERVGKNVYVETFGSIGLTTEQCADVAEWLKA